MIKINLYSVGKNKEDWLNTALLSFQERLKGHLKLSYHWTKTSEAMLKALKKEKYVLCFDPKGSALTSEEFAKALDKGLTQGGAQLALVIGEAQGLTEELKKYPMISFSKMIFTHQLSRLIVAEQIYRAVQIWNNTPYHFS